MIDKILFEDISKYKYELKRLVIYDLGYRFDFVDEYIQANEYLAWATSFTGGYNLIIRKGYRWDGPSGPTIDTTNFMRASLVHDALYQLMRENLLSKSCRKRADKVMYDICREDGMSWFRAQYIYRAVRMFGASHVRPS